MPSSIDESVAGLKLPPRLTLLTMKDLHKGTAPTSGQQPLSPKYDVLSGIIVPKLQNHTDQYKTIAQKGIGNNIRNSKHQLLIDGAVTQDSRSR